MKEVTRPPLSFPEGPHLAKEIRTYIIGLRSFIEERRAEEDVKGAPSDLGTVNIEDAKAAKRVTGLNNLEGKCKTLENLAIRLAQTPRDQKLLADVKNKYRSLIDEAEPLRAQFSEKRPQSHLDDEPQS